MKSAPVNITDKIQDPTSQSAVEDEWPAMPVETEIYIMPDGRVVVADLPAELAGLMEEWTVVHDC